MRITLHEDYKYKSGPEGNEKAHASDKLAHLVTRCGTSASMAAVAGTDSSAPFDNGRRPEVEVNRDGSRGDG